ncbi:MAG: RNA polymerase sigma factor [Hyphomicrobium sp.]|nr:RNA polymerase sigma factor [Hyphomicrobium sp.]
MGADVRDELVSLLPRLRRFAHALSGSRDEAEDIVQSAVEKALGRLDQFELGTRLDSWMFQIVRTTWIDRHRRASRRPQAAGDGEIDNVSFDARIHEQAEARMSLEIIRTEMTKLPEEQREILALVTVDGMSYQEAASSLGIPIGTVMSRLARARRKLADAIDRPPTRHSPSGAGNGVHK